MAIAQTLLSGFLFLLHFLLPSSSPSYILTVAPLVIPPLLCSSLLFFLSHSLARSAAVYSARERERPERGQCRLSERPSTPRLSKEVCMGASQHSFYKLHSRPPQSRTHTLTYHTHTSHPIFHIVLSLSHPFYLSQISQQPPL